MDLKKEKIWWEVVKQKLLRDMLHYRDDKDGSGERNKVWG